MPDEIVLDPVQEFNPLKGTGLDHQFDVSLPSQVFEIGSLRFQIVFLNE